MPQPAAPRSGGAYTEFDRVSNRLRALTTSGRVPGISVAVTTARTTGCVARINPNPIRQRSCAGTQLRGLLPAGIVGYRHGRYRAYDVHGIFEALRRVRWDGVHHPVGPAAPERRP